MAFRVAFCAGAVFFLAGCGGGGVTAIPPTQGVAITGQPLSQTIPLDQAATFTVTATGTAPLAYQWSENGKPISGATGASYTVSNVIASDTGSQFTVTVTDSMNSVTSNVAILSVGPRSPKPGDLRFQEVGSSSEAEQGTPESTSGYVILEQPGFSAQETFKDNAVGSPITIGANGECYQFTSAPTCVWGYFVAPLPAGQSGLNAYVLASLYSNFDSDLTSNPIQNQLPPNSPNSVITSLDFQPAYNAYGMAWVQSSEQGGAFDLKREIVAPGAVESTVTADAAASRVITAVSFDANGQANLLSYGWQGDTATMYDSAVITAANQQEIESDAQTLASQGYILTAFGGDPINGFLLIGTKVQGDTIPRSLLIFDQTTSACPGCGTNYAPVAYYQAPSGPDYAVIYEK